MEITVFAKKRTSREGKHFYSFISTLTNKSGEKRTVSVRFRDECGSPRPENCPLNIIFDKKNANLTSKEFIREDTGLVSISYTLWVSAWETGTAYIDHSLDDFE